MRYLYATKSRPFNADVYLIKGFVMASTNRDVDDYNYYDLLIYDRKLEKEEVKEYELEYIGGFNYEF